MDPRARWPDGTPVGNPFRPGSFRWSLITEWGLWEDLTRKQMAEVMDVSTQYVGQEIMAVARITNWTPPVPEGQAGKRKGR